jgi:hypothetical protein
MSEMQEKDTTPTLEVRILRDGAIVQRELCATEAEANAVVEAWSDVDGVTVEVEDLARSTRGAGVLDPRPWEVDADDLVYEGSVETEEEER